VIRTGGLALGSTEKGDGWETLSLAAANAMATNGVHSRSIHSSWGTQFDQLLQARGTAALSRRSKYSVLTEIMNGPMTRAKQQGYRTGIRGLRVPKARIPLFFDSTH
jgi:hypothetical protein